MEKAWKISSEQSEEAAIWLISKSLFLKTISRNSATVMDISRYCPQAWATDSYKVDVAQVYGQWPGVAGLVGCSAAPRCPT